MQVHVNRKRFRRILPDAAASIGAPRREGRGEGSGSESQLPQGPKRKIERRRKMERRPPMSRVEEGLLYWAAGWWGGVGRLSANGSVRRGGQVLRSWSLEARLRGFVNGCEFSSALRCAVSEINGSDGKHSILAIFCWYKKQCCVECCS